MDITKGRDVLPKNVKPLHYDLTLEPDFETFKYDGEVTVDLDVVEDTKSITLNTIEIEIHETKISTGSTTITSSPKVTVD